jgi:hypothetical protein
MKTTTLNKIRAHGLYADGWTGLLKNLGKIEADDEPLPFSVLVEASGLDYSLRCTKSAPEYNEEWRLFAVWCAKQVEHLLENRSITLFDIAERFAHGSASYEELDAAKHAARAIAESARAIEWAVAGDVARTAMWATQATAWSVAADARVAAMGVVQDAQKERFLELVG